MIPQRIVELRVCPFCIQRCSTALVRRSAAFRHITLSVINVTSPGLICLMKSIFLRITSSVIGNQDDASSVLSPALNVQLCVSYEELYGLNPSSIFSKPQLAMREDKISTVTPVSSRNARRIPVFVRQNSGRVFMNALLRCASIAVDGKVYSFHRPRYYKRHRLDD